MKNVHLERKLNRAKDEMESAITDLVNWIEEQEKEIDGLTDQVEALEAEVMDLRAISQ